MQSVIFQFDSQVWRCKRLELTLHRTSWRVEARCQIQPSQLHHATECCRTVWAPLDFGQGRDSSSTCIDSSRVVGVKSPLEPRGFWGVGIVDWEADSSGGSHVAVDLRCPSVCHGRGGEYRKGRGKAQVYSSPVLVAQTLLASLCRFGLGRVGQEDCYDDAHGESLLIETQHDLRERFGRVSRRDHDSSGRDGIVHGGVRVCQPGSHWILSASSTAAAVAFNLSKRDRNQRNAHVLFWCWVWRWLYVFLYPCWFIIACAVHGPGHGAINSQSERLLSYECVFLWERFVFQFYKL